MTASRFRFRVWCPDNKRMEYFDLLNTDLNYNFATGNMINEEGPTMQSSGLTDKNGKEIFEGDIVKFWASFGIEYINICGTGVVIWEGAGFTIVDNKVRSAEEWAKHLMRYSVNGTNEIIGNIHENPELLEKGK